MEMENDIASEKECITGLAEAIVVQACQDFKRCITYVSEIGPNVLDALAEMQDIIDFINSEWYETLTDFPKEKLLRRLKELFPKDWPKGPIFEFDLDTTAAP